MTKRDLFGNEEVWECETPEEARQMWRDCPEDRWRLWSVEEVTAHLLDTPEQLRECIALKKAKPGKL